MSIYAENDNHEKNESYALMYMSTYIENDKHEKKLRS